MPYIKQESRNKFEHGIESILNNLSDDDENAVKGELNYVIYSIIKRYIEANGVRYHRFNDLVGGVLSCCQMELYRKLVAPYEEDCIDKNGDV